MIDELKRKAREWPGEAVVLRRDDKTDSWIFIALHSSVLGRPVGGTRLRIYEHPTDGLEDALRLAEGMTHKWSSIGLPIGGGKAVLALDRPLSAEERVCLIKRYGDLVESMEGAFGTGEDLGTTPEDMSLLAKHTQYVHGVKADGSASDPGPYTAEGVFHGTRAAVRHVTGQDSLEGLSVLLQGAGDVGYPLARRLAGEGAHLKICDVDLGLAHRVASELGGVTVAPENVYETPCDIFAPCALGSILNAKTVSKLPCRIVAGSANNQLEEPLDGQALHDRGIVYVPDYVINAGGALAFGLVYALDNSIQESENLMSRMAEIGIRVEDLLTESETRNLPPHQVALEISQRRIDGARGSNGNQPTP